MPRAGFGKSGGYRRIREGRGGGTAVWPPAVRRGVQTKKGRHPRGRWGAEARRVERCGFFICRAQAASHAGVYWEQVGRLCTFAPLRTPSNKRDGSST